jgi:hypothetical protein
MPKFTGDCCPSIPPEDRARFVRAVEHLHQLGQRATGEAIAELAKQAGVDPLPVLDRYRQFDRATLRALGADDWTMPLRPPARRP